MNKNLPPYRAEGPCSKCGGDKIATAYHEGRDFPLGESCPPRDTNKHAGDHLHRYCQRCHYSWCEDVVRPSGAREE